MTRRSDDRVRRAARQWDLPVAPARAEDLDERLRAGRCGRTGWMQVLIDHDTPAGRCPGCGWDTTTQRRDCPSRVIAKALLERAPLPAWLAHLAEVVPGAGDVHPGVAGGAAGRTRRVAGAVRGIGAAAGASAMTAGGFDAVVSTPQASSMDASEGSAIGAPMVAALEAAWSAIRVRNPELPSVVIVLGAGSGERGGLRLGHFAAMRWSATDVDEDGHRLAEVFVGGEGLARGSVDVFGTLLHEAAHALAHVRGVQDTSRQGRWHNARFKAIATEVGIAVEKDPRLGWSPTTVPDATRDIYADVIGELARALRMRRASEPGGAEKPRKPGPPACVCGCGRRIRVAVSVREAGPIVCGVCEAEFRPEEPVDDSDAPDATDGSSGDGEVNG